ncbi:VPLPA-CTERM sorting domain-containing protein [Poseidonocella sedimentorum]|uniref:VPLPA-CTERM protein sorting domain-containing protein n=1 Tax=Poseidonocella sedimentorum TaxID=871652 RepID=A0A1I6CX25_9RHOB|nr:VPLPA-CTERM sorting domain-containing protein [Poseidonocella sedimentorum]SFQ97825.1 VPLPA-CTERM protein sorting domain-containing protein [Poseidonocella sedimentorum]
MTHSRLLAGTALSLLALAPLTAQAATCTSLGTDIACLAPGSGPVSSGTDAVQVIVAIGASIESDDEDVPAVALTGDAVSVVNSGTITQTNTSNGGHAILGEGDIVTIVNDGTISSGDRGIEMDGGSDLTVLNAAGATISARRQAIRAGTDSPNAFVSNAGTITSTEGRALQLRSFGASVFNTGEIIGGEEVIEARGDFYLENSGTIRLIDDSIEDEDAVQFAGGEVQNFGQIIGSDDGIDVDEGLIVNHAGGLIKSTAPDANDNGGIDIDEVYDDGVSALRAPTSLTIINDGTIEGPKAINTDPAAVSSLFVTNRGILNGRGGTAIALAAGMGDSSLELDGGSEVYGDVIFGGGDDELGIMTITSGLLGTGIFDGGTGSNTLSFGAGLAAFESARLSGNRLELSFLSGGDLLSGTFLNFGTVVIGGARYTASEAAALIAAAPVPLPAGLPLLLAGLGGFGLLRRWR